MSGKNATERLAVDAAGIARAAELLRAGGIVALPSETVYGLAARADSEAAVGRIYTAKGRPSRNPLIVHVADIAAAEDIGIMDDRARRLAEDHWPGPLTLVVPLRCGSLIASSVTAGLPTVALRAPAHPVFQAVLKATGSPLAAPSANSSGRLSPTSALHVLDSLDDGIDAVLDGGSTQAGLESTIVAVRDDGSLSILREGPIDLGSVSDPASVTGCAVEAPGQLLRHYSPGKPMRLNAHEALPGEVLIGFGTVRGDLSLSPSGDLDEAARMLYAVLHMAARRIEQRIAVAPLPAEGLGRAINDRLQRAAS